MIKKMAQRLKEEKGLTLIELLAVVVILGIIAAIAIPSIGGLIDNSKKDAHVGNAQQMINSAKTWVSGNSDDAALTTTNGKTLTLQDMEDANLVDTIKDPDKGAYDTAKSFVVIKKTGDGKFSYTVTLTNGTRGIFGADDGSLSRSSVVSAAGH